MNIPGDEFYTLITAALKKRGEETLQRTLYLAVREAVLQGRLQAESRLPGSRVIAQQLSVSRNTVNAALEQLSLEGYLLRSRQGTRVAQLAQRGNRQDFPEPTVTLAKRVTQLPEPTPRETPVLALRPARQPSIIFLFRSGGACTIAFYARKGVHCLAMAIRPGNPHCVRRLPAILPCRGGLIAMPARLLLPRGLWKG